MGSISSKSAPSHALLGSLILVAATTLFFPSVEGYGTRLFQVVDLGAWALVAAVTSGAFADRHHFIIWPLAGVLNVLFFSFVAVPMYLLLHRRAPVLIQLILAVWLLFYVAGLFVIFPATDGP